MSVDKTNNTIYLATTLENNIDLAIRFMLEDIHREAEPITPYKSGALRTMVSKTMNNPHSGSIVWHAPYAEYQERGYTSGPVRHYTTPGTHAHFAQQSVEKVIANSRDYFVRAGAIR